MDEISSGPISGGIKGEAHLYYNQSYDVFLKPPGAVGPGTVYSSPQNVKTTFEQRYDYNDGAFVGSELISH